MKLRSVLLEGEKDFDQQDPWILVESKNKKKAKQTKILLEDLETSDPQELRPVIGEQEEISRTVQELEKVVIIRPARGQMGELYGLVQKSVRA